MLAVKESRICNSEFLIQTFIGEDIEEVGNIQHRENIYFSINVFSFNSDIFLNLVQDV